jgi:hypothetical protein
MPRSKNASQRRQVLARLREVKIYIKRLEAEWTVLSTVWVPPVDRAPGANSYQRDRLPEEYPEEQAIAWAHVYNATDEMIRKLTELRELALKRYRETVPEYEVER